MPRPKKHRPSDDWTREYYAWRLARIGAGAFAKIVKNFEKNDGLSRPIAIRMARETMINVDRKKSPALSYEMADLFLSYMIHLAAQPAPPKLKRRGGA